MMPPSESGIYKVYQRMTSLSKMVSWLPNLLDIHYSSTHRPKVKIGSWRNTSIQSTLTIPWLPWTTPNSKIISWNSAWKTVTLWLSRTSKMKSTPCWTQSSKNKSSRRVNYNSLMSEDYRLNSIRISNSSWPVDWPTPLSHQNCQPNLSLSISPSHREVSNNNYSVWSFPKNKKLWKIVCRLYYLTSTRIKKICRDWIKTCWTDWPIPREIFWMIPNWWMCWITLKLKLKK